MGMGAGVFFCAICGIIVVLVGPVAQLVRARAS